MPFPDGVSLIDDFNRASLGANYGVLVSGVGQLSITGNQLVSPAGDTASYYNAATFGPDVYMTVDLPTVGGNGFYLYARISNPGVASVSGYEVGWNLGLSRVNVTRLDSGAFTNLATLSSITYSSGDSIGMSCVGTTIAVWRRSGGTWSQLLSATDSTYSAAGFIALEIDVPGSVLDNLSAGYPDAAPWRNPGPIRFITGG